MRCLAFVVLSASYATAEKPFHVCSARVMFVVINVKLLVTDRVHV